MKDSSLPDYRIVRSSRKTVAIHIAKNAEVEVRAPYGVPKRFIAQCVASKKDWIVEKQALLLQRAHEKASFLIEGGTLLTVLGESRPVHLAEGTHARYDGEIFTLPSKLSQDERKFVLARLYQAIAKKALPPMVQKMASKYGFSFAGVGITSAKTRWGSCSSGNRLNFTWRLLALPLPLTEYVIIHELCHTRAHNHSPAFWREVAAILPDYKKSRAALKATRQETMWME